MSSLRFLNSALALACLSSAAAGTDFQLAPFGAPVLAGLLTDSRLIEFSGLAPSAQKNRFWAVNDGGQAAVLFHTDGSGKIVSEMTMQGVVNVDFEDLTSFRWQGEDYVAVGDIGDNAAVMPEHSIYVMHDQAKNSQAPAWRVRYRYPDRPHDAESLMTDTKEGFFYIVNKRVMPPTMYRVPIKPSTNEVVVAETIGQLDNLPIPDPEVDDESNRVRFASQPTGAVLGCDGRELLLLTYASVYRYTRQANQSWAQALPGQRPQFLPLPPMVQAEAITLSRDCKHLYVGGEKIPGVLWRFARRKSQ